MLSQAADTNGGFSLTEFFKFLHNFLSYSDLSGRFVEITTI